MGKFNILSFLFLSIGVIAKISGYLFISSDIFYYSFLKFTLLLAVVCPIIGVILGTFGNKGKQKHIAIASNIVFLCIFSPLALLNLLILTFGK
jgi:hypothetical protein